MATIHLDTLINQDKEKGEKALICTSCIAMKKKDLLILGSVGKLHKTKFKENDVLDIPAHIHYNHSTAALP